MTSKYDLPILYVLQDSEEALHLATIRSRVKRYMDDHDVSYSANTWRKSMFNRVKELLKKDYLVYFGRVRYAISDNGITRLDYLLSHEKLREQSASPRSLSRGRKRARVQTESVRQSKTKEKELMKELKQKESEIQNYKAELQRYEELYRSTKQPVEPTSSSQASEIDYEMSSQTWIGGDDEFMNQDGEPHVIEQNEFERVGESTLMDQNYQHFITEPDDAHPSTMERPDAIIENYPDENEDEPTEQKEQELKIRDYYSMKYEIRELKASLEKSLKAQDEISKSFELQQANLEQAQQHNIELHNHLRIEQEKIHSLQSIERQNQDLSQQNQELNQELERIREEANRNSQSHEELCELKNALENCDYERVIASNLLSEISKMVELYFRRDSRVDKI